MSHAFLFYREPLPKVVKQIHCSLEKLSGSRLTIPTVQSAVTFTELSLLAVQSPSFLYQEPRKNIAINCRISLCNVCWQPLLVFFFPWNNISYQGLTIDEDFTFPQRSHSSASVWRLLHHLQFFLYSLKCELHCLCELFQRHSLGFWRER